MRTSALGAILSLVLLAPSPACAESPESPVEADAASPTPGRLPGAEPFPPELELRLAAALLSEGPGYVPRTRHVMANGAPLYVNRLIFEGSPYLRQHAHNPVNWYPWGDEAFETARRTGRPVLLSIGYSTCHWCHVMEEESFEDVEIAAFLNEHYVAIKVDREERPDLDAIYMAAVQALTGRGGWPMTTWLTPDRQPFFGGTYFPPRDGDRGSRTGFLTLLGQLAERYHADPTGIAQHAAELARTVQVRLGSSPGDSLPDSAPLALAARGYAGRFDSENGGLSGSPKFPSSLPVRFLLREHRRTGEARWLEMAERTLHGMADGGIHDQIGGGFHRYATDAAWRIPHFEKMLYDNALLAVTYLEGWQASGEARFAAVAGGVLDYLAREMTAPGGGFYSATDADSPTPDGNREEGWFFTWTPAEIEAVLGAEDAGRVASWYGVTGPGNFEGRNILYRSRSGAEGATEASIEPARARLYSARARRPAPLRDDKILTSWNGLAITAFAWGGFVLDRPDYVRRAEAAADYLLAKAYRDGRLLRSTIGGEARHPAFLDDYAFLIEGLLQLFQATGDRTRLTQATALQQSLDRHYADPAGGYFMTADNHEVLLAREKPSYDGAEPSGNSVALANLLRFGALTGDPAWLGRAEALLRSFGPGLARSPTSHSEMLLGLDYWLDGGFEVVVVEPASGVGADALVETVRRSFAPNKVVLVVGEAAARRDDALPIVRGKRLRDGRATAYVCRQGVCRLPTTEASVLAEQLAALPAPSASAATPPEG